ncbi:MAG: hypothetical protein D6728_11640 [Cyanobacteria bacterium J055]|nr:MAG: hypothetical protein D6728_11640 [Cyanobacteria bacterium J055]
MSLAIGIQQSAVYPNLRECLGDANENIRIALSAASSALLIPTAFRKDLVYVGGRRYHDTDNRYSTIQRVTGIVLDSLSVN